MYHANQPNRAQRAAEAAAQHSADVRELARIRQCQRDQPSSEWPPEHVERRDARADELKAKLFPPDSNESGGLGQAIAKQRLASCRNIAQQIADFIAGEGAPVDLTAEPDANYPGYMALRDSRPMQSRVNALVRLGREAGFNAQDEARVRTADEAEVQTYEAAVYAALSTAGATPKPLPEQGDESWPVAPAAWGVR